MFSYSQSKRVRLTQLLFLVPSNFYGDISHEKILQSNLPHVIDDHCDVVANYWLLRS